MSIFSLLAWYLQHDIPKKEMHSKGYNNFNCFTIIVHYFSIFSIFINVQWSQLFVYFL